MELPLPSDQANGEDLAASTMEVHSGSASPSSMTQLSLKAPNNKTHNTLVGRTMELPATETMEVALTI